MQRKKGVQRCIVTEGAETVRNKGEESRDRGCRYRDAEAKTWRCRVAETRRSRDEKNRDR